MTEHKAYRREDFKLYGTQRWRKIAKQQLEEKPLCAACLAEERITPATVADHVMPHKGDEEKFWNGELQSLCTQCHEWIKDSVERRGYHNAIGIDGYPTDPNHPWNKEKA